MGKAQDELVSALTAALDNSNCSQDDKLKALGAARAHVNKPATSSGLEDWRERRAKRGAFSKSAKKDEASK